MRKVLILGSGALQIGQAGEFDYSGSQAIKALKEEGLKVVLVNPNIATIQTSKGLANKVYFLPVNFEFVKEIIEKEKPDGIMLSFGGQTALNCGLELGKGGILKKHGVKVLGTSISTILQTEDRDLFRIKMNKLGLPIGKSVAVCSKREAIKALKEFKFPIMLRSAFALGGLGSALVTDKRQLNEKLNLALCTSEQILMEEYLGGWKEIEYEVVRDKCGNKVTVCNMENMDPMGIHTGESIVVAPSQTLTNKEYFTLRQVSLDCIEGLGIIGECNIQFAVNPRKFEYRVIEVNARLSRSSALASKATGYPLAFIAAKLALGFKLPDIKNAVVKTTTSFFEPALDYLVVKIPRWDLLKFTNADDKLGSEMKSVGEVMAIGRSFPEAIQKAARMLDVGYLGIIPRDRRKIDYKKELSNPTPERVFLVVKALLGGISVGRIHKLTKINRWFIYQLKEITDFYKKLLKEKRKNRKLIKKAKKLGFSDAMLAEIFGTNKLSIRKYRLKHNIKPVVKKIDTLAGEFPAKTNYLYMTYHGDKSDIFDLKPNFKKISKSSALGQAFKKIGILGGGPYRIGSSVEFDWCAVSTAWKFREEGYRTIMINCNPETVSTDYDSSDILYFEELTLERILDIVDFENVPLVVSMGGQVSNNLALPLKKSGIKILGTNPKNINKAEDRDKFSKLLDKIDIKQPEWFRITGKRQAFKKAAKLGYPVLLRPSFVLSGEAMFVAFRKRELREYLKSNKTRGIGFPLTMSKYYREAIEVDIDGVGFRGNLVRCILLEHIEHAGVHSGDATLVYPPRELAYDMQSLLVKQTERIVKNLKINGPFNIQFLVKNGETRVIECNLRASRSFPFSSKATGINLIKLSVDAMINNKKTSLKPSFKGISKSSALNYSAVKVSQFSFSRLRGVDPVLRIEMSSTGEVASFASNIHEAYLKAFLSTGVKLPRKAVLLSLGGDQDKRSFLTSAQLLSKIGFRIYATEGSTKYYRNNGLKVKQLYKIYKKKRPDVKSAIVDGLVDLVICTKEKPNVGFTRFKNQVSDGFIIRRAAIDHGVTLITNLKAAALFVESLAYMQEREFEIKAWNEYFNH
jgi:carbamoyl-phosphate synthase large subunit